MMKTILGRRAGLGPGKLQPATGIANDAIPADLTKSRLFMALSGL